VKEPAFRRALLVEGVEALIAGDLDAGKILLRDYINATLGFDELARATDIPAKSLMRMFGPDGNPQARNLFAVVAALQKREKVALAVAPVRARR
jgi:DNA-binding phage protein